MWRPRWFRRAPWRPNKHVELNLLESIAPVRADVVRSFKEDRSRITNELAAAGTLRSGNFPSALGKSAETKVNDYADTAAKELLDAIKQIYGSIPPRAKNWLMSVYEKQVGVLAKQLVDEIDSAPPLKRIVVSSWHHEMLDALVQKRVTRFGLDIDREFLARSEKRKRWVGLMFRNPIVAAIVGAIVTAIIGALIIQLLG